MLLGTPSPGGRVRTAIFLRKALVFRPAPARNREVIYDAYASLALSTASITSPRACVGPPGEVKSTGPAGRDGCPKPRFGKIGATLGLRSPGFSTLIERTPPFGVASRPPKVAFARQGSRDLAIGAQGWHQLFRSALLSTLLVRQAPWTLLLRTDTSKHENW